ncbi:hypothetical protein KKF91_07200 [Myxococcota bacterium]|nr:hypothetical protein [Myxococcota bacterium]MBU1430339.1 hypothetical protein [Myxococcota bacterium]MBU1896388.1 hypothetical protein [Myxococcota bacterium]
MLLLLTLVLASPPPEGDDPFLDRPPQREAPRRVAPPRSPTGFVIGAHVGLYAGAVRSYLTSEEGKLENSARAAIGLGIGARTPSLIELGLDLDFGLGQMWSTVDARTAYAFDALIQPRILAHVFERGPRSLYLGLGLDGILFNIKAEGIYQGGLGPTAILGAHHRLDAYSLIYLELAACAFYDRLAFHYEDPSEEASAEDPSLGPSRVNGAWYRIFRLNLGYRLTSF